MTRRLRLILPPPVLLTAIIAPVLAVEGMFFYVEWRFGQGVPVQRRAPLELMFLGLPAVGYGLYRVLGFHPYYRPNYRAWLELTPWTSRKPLPVGPASLIWEDGVVLSLLCLLATLCPSVNPLRLLTVFLAAHAAGLGWSLVATGCRGWGCAVAFGLGLVSRLWLDPLAAIGAAVVVSLAAHAGLRRSLSRFPWSLEWQKVVFRAGQIELTEPKPGVSCGWPFDRLRPRVAGALTLRYLDALVLGLLAGWWAFALQGLFSDPRERAPFVVMLLSGTLGGVPTLRCFAYVVGYAPPISFWGRLVTRRWIVPGYDVVFIAPLCALAVPSLILYELKSAGLDMEVAAPIALAVSVMLGLGMDPGFDRWRLTGHHRIYPNPNQRDLVKLG